MLGITISRLLVPVPMTTRPATVFCCLVYLERLLLLAPTTLRVTRRPRSKPAITIHRTWIRRASCALLVVVTIRTAPAAILRIPRDFVVPVFIAIATRATRRT